MRETEALKRLRDAIIRQSFEATDDIVAVCITILANTLMERAINDAALSRDVATTHEMLDATINFLRTAKIKRGLQ
jgi:hypothetical protein